MVMIGSLSLCEKASTKGKVWSQEVPSENTHTHKYTLTNPRVRSFLRKLKHKDFVKQAVMGKGGRRVNTVQQMCAHACKCKNYTCCSCSMNWGIKESNGRGEFKYDTVGTL
jgi:hypothetical protein